MPVNGAQEVHQKDIETLKDEKEKMHAKVARLRKENSELSGKLKTAVRRCLPQLESLKRTMSDLGALKKEDKDDKGGPAAKGKEAKGQMNGKRKRTEL
eukprot:1700602-Rhodomonas_salina.1